MGLALALAVMAWRMTRSSSAVEFVTAPITRGDVTRAINASGTVNPQTTVQVGTYVSGTVQSITCDYNTQVKKGQSCARIDPRPYQTIVDQDRANLASAKAQLEKDRANLDLQEVSYRRNRQMYDAQLISRDQFDQADAAYQQAKSQLQVSQATVTQRTAALSSSEVNLGYTNIVSPVDGTVVSRNITIGQTVAASFQTPTLFLIATDLAKMQVDTNVAEGDIGGVAMNAHATFTVEAFPDRRFDGVVTQIRQAPQAVQNVITYDVVVTAPNAELLLKPGMTANVRIIVDRRENALRAPDQALRYTPGGVATSADANRPGTPSPGLFGFGRGVPRGAGRVPTRSGGPGGQGGAGAQQTHVTAPAEPRPATIYVLRDGHPVAIDVTIGLDDDTNTEIVSGDLKEGDRVIVSEAPRRSGT
jgi:HlyD family secretion protein